MLTESLGASERYLRVLPYLKRLKNWKLNFELSCISETITGSWSSLWSEEHLLSHTKSSKSYSLANDGTYVYLHGSLGLLKIGTGNNGAIRGRVYQHNADWFPDYKSSLACVDNYLYFRSHCAAPASLIVLHCGNLTVGVFFVFFLLSFLLLSFLFVRVHRKLAEFFKMDKEVLVRLIIGIILLVLNWKIITIWIWPILKLVYLMCMK